MSEILGSGVAFPLQVDRRGGIALARDETDIDQAILLILGTAPGERPKRPEGGGGVPAWECDTIDAAPVARMETEIRAALDRWEPRVEVTDVQFDLDGTERGELVIHITYRVRATNHVRNLVHPFYVIPAEEGAE
jgi:phage baseplate assembly protein W